MQTNTHTFNGALSLLLYQFTFITGALLITAPFMTHDNRLELVTMLAALLVCSGASTLVAINRAVKISKTAASLLFSLWMLVWLVN